MLFAAKAFEFGVLDFIHRAFSCEFMNFLMVGITTIGDKGLVWIVVGIVMVCTKKYRKNGIWLLVGLLGGLIFGNLLLKNLVARPRPFAVADVPILIPKPTDFSFPSGHTVSSFIAAFVLWRTDKKRFGIPAMILASLMAFSRLYLYVHFPSDVLCGIALAYLVYLAIRKHLDKGM